MGEGDRWAGARSNGGTDRARGERWVVARSNKGSDRVGDGRVRARSSRGVDRRARSSRGKDSGRFGQKVECRKGNRTKFLKGLWR
jgi:hypothetical protein